MTQADLDQSYTQLCNVLSRVGEANALQFLSRFALLSLLNCRETTEVEQMIEKAAAGLGPDN